MSYHLKHNLFLLSLPFLLMACGGGSSGDSNNPPSTYTVGGGVSGLATGQSLTLNINGGDELTVNSNSAFTFATALTSGSTYNVTVSTPPAGQSCSLTNSAGTVASSNVTNVSISCNFNPYTIAVSNPAAASVSITGTTQTNTASTATSITFNDTYGDTNVTVSASKTGNTCTVGGTAIPNPITGNVTGVTVSCTPITYTLSGSNNTGATLSANGSTATTGNTITGTTSFSLSARYGDPVVFTASKTGNTCSISGSSINPVAGAVSDLSVTCTPITHNVSGTITGYSTSGILLSLTLTDTTTTSTLQTIPSIASGAASFNFTTSVPEGHNWTVTVATQPAGQTCLTFNGSGSNISTDVKNVTLSCSSTTYTIGGTVSGLGTGLSVSLLNNGGDALTINANGSFQFASALASGATFAVTVDTQPTGQICTVTAGTGTTSNSDISNVVVSCKTVVCSSATNASPLNTDPLWAIYSSPTDPSTRTTPNITGELADPFGDCQGT